VVEALEGVLGNLDSISGCVKALILYVLLFFTVQMAIINVSLPRHIAR